MRLLAGLLTKFIRNGRLRLYDAVGGLHEFGSGEDGPTVTVRLHDRALERKLALNPELIAAEAYMDGTLTFEDGATVHQFLELFSVNRSGLASAGSQKLIRRLWRGVKRWQQANPLGVASRNVRHHYDLSTDLFRLFLDAGLNYSCAYYRDPETDTLEGAQEAKLVHIAAKPAIPAILYSRELQAESDALNARLVLTLANHIGDRAVLTEALAVAKSAG